MPHHPPTPIDPAMTRRELLRRSGMGFGSLALGTLLSESGGLARAATGSTTTPLAARPPQFAPKAKRVIHLFMNGGPSQVDTFDPKPELSKQSGKAIPLDLRTERKTGSAYGSPFKFKKYGQSGLEVSEIFARTAEHADDLCVIRAMKADVPNHEPSLMLMNCGDGRLPRPSMGSWISYGLGSLNDNLPTFVVLPDPRGFAPNGPKNWGSGFLPAEHQASMVQPSAKTPIADLFAPADGYVSAKSDADALDLLATLNRQHETTRPGDSRLDARIRSYELAARMQLSAPEVLDLRQEPEHILRMYGLDRDNTITPATPQINAAQEIEYFGRNCLTARRLLERGVRFVQIWSGADNGHPRRNWDSHEDLGRDHGPLALGLGVGAAALIKDLKQRGMLDDTIILWTTEFGRMPCNQGSLGRDHNPFVFTNWLAGGGIRGGVTYGESDEWSYKPLDRDRPTYCYDVHATILHQLGIDHERLVYRSNGIDRRLTDVHGQVIREIIA
jgi:hypothetical protein